MKRQQDTIPPRRSLLPTYAAVLAVLGALALFRWRELGWRIKALWLVIGSFRSRRQPHVVRDVRYGEHPRLLLDIFPPVEAENPAPVAVFAHGGAFEHYDKNLHALVGAALQAAGFAAVTFNYRLHPSVTYPVYIEDGAAALNWVREHIAEYGGDPKRIAMLGHSAGGIMATLLNLDGPRYGLEPGTVRAVVSLSGLYDYESPDYRVPRWVAIMGGETNFHGPAQPMRVAANGLSAPLLIVHGGRDKLIPLDNARRFYETLHRAGQHVEFLPYNQMNHYTTLFELANHESELAAQIALFVRTHTEG